MNRFLKGKRYGCVVDILRSKSEMDKFNPFAKTGLLKPVLDEIFDGFHIMVCDLLNVFHLGSILGSHIPVYIS